MIKKKEFIEKSLKESSEIKLKVLERCNADIINVSEIFADCI